tara:strand:+ start:2166 stop:2504 length:339 start_codon:yes stop_codon:yes gene_type:complete
MEHQQWETQFIYLKDKSKAINLKQDKKQIKKKYVPNKDNKLNKKIEEGNLKHDKITVELRKMITDTRCSKNLTQKQLATQCNLPLSVINDIESGKAQYNPNQINKIKRFLKI